MKEETKKMLKRQKALEELKVQLSKEQPCSHPTVEYVMFPNYRYANGGLKICNRYDFDKWRSIPTIRVNNDMVRGSVAITACPHCRSWLKWIPKEKTKEEETEDV